MVPFSSSLAVRRKQVPTTAVHVRGFPRKQFDVCAAIAELKIFLSKPSVFPSKETKELSHDANTENTNMIIVLLINSTRSLTRPEPPLDQLQ